MNKKTTVTPKFKKITLNLPTTLYKDIQEDASRCGLNVTSEIITLCREGLKQNQALIIAPELLEAFAKNYDSIRKKNNSKSKKTS